MNVMKAIDTGSLALSNEFEAANQALENLKGALANHGCFPEALRVSEMLREFDRTRYQYVHHGDL
jgi:hypothetical protein